ncbi:serine/threonine protein kinase [Pyxidicoccus parkwayensis]|uniref:non-specific serine/threonine protein kinase n=1 Tax=Pyxidicoccus parkwayensis TaxID=2813578 RepID=A0ABX7NN99_9BACT|nr:serine/threonine-protein kinase [Pyxidicoccus parkwaysis]QSQ20336.1 serine/threonine protein kinase [Pyxidicoccus parkwaysis]
MSLGHMLDAPAGTDIAGFAVDGLLGVGGHGVVYRATRGGEAVALKLQPLEPMRLRAEREVSLLSRLEHRNVVGFRGSGLYPERSPRWFYLAMEYVRGRTLSRWLEEEDPCARRAAEVLRGLARGLEAAHAAEVLHRDIKESNVVVREEDGEPVLVDFGVATRAGAPRLTTGVLPPGTPRYRSPEALAFQRDSHPGARYVATRADDLYALGVVFYRVLTGRHPFPRVETPSEVEAVIAEVPAAPHARNPRVPEELGTLCLRLLAKRPEARGTARELRESLDAALAGADARWDVPLGEAEPEGVPSADGHPEPLDAWLRAREAATTPALRVRAPLASEAAPPESVMFRATAVLGMAAGLVLAVLLAMDRHSPAAPGNLAPARGRVDAAATTSKRACEDTSPVAPACDSWRHGPTRLPTPARSVP